MYFLIKFRVRLLIFKGEEILFKGFFLFVMFYLYWISNICNEKNIIRENRVFKNVLFFD